MHRIKWSDYGTRIWGDWTGVIIFGMIGCQPCKELDGAVANCGSGCEVVYVSCRPSEARKLMEDGTIGKFPTARAVYNGRTTLELVGFPTAHERQEAYIRYLLYSAGWEVEA